MKRFISNKNYLYFIGILLFIILWKLLAISLGHNTMVLPGPEDTIKYSIYLLQRPYTYKCILSTMLKMFTGFLISLISGLILGIIAGNNENLEKIFNPSIIVLRSIPTASIIYFFIVLLGFKLAPMCLVVVIGFPIIYQAVLGGIKSVPEEIIRASKVDGAGYIRSNLMVKLPLALPYLIVGSISSFSLSFKVEIMAEVITSSSNPGIGSAIFGARSSDPTNMVPVLAYSLIAVVIMLLIDYISHLIINKFDKSIL